MALPAGESTVLRYQREKRPKSGGNNARGAQRIEQTVQRRGNFFCCGAVRSREVGNGTSHRHWAGCARRAGSTCCARGTCSAGYAGRTCCTGRARGSIWAGCASWANASCGTGRTCCTGGPSRAAGRTGRARGTGRTSRTRRSRRTRGSSSTSGTLRSHQSHGPHGSLRSGWPCRAGWACGTYRAGNGAAGRNAAVSPTVGRALIHFHSKNHPSVVVWSGFRVFDARRAVARTGRV